MLLLLLLIPVGADIAYRDTLALALKYGGIKVYDSKKKRQPSQDNVKSEERSKEKAQNKKKENFISKIFKEKGKIEGIKFCFSLIKAVISKIVWVIRKIKFKNFYLNISVASEDAAKTAVIYGTVCAAVYPVITLIDQNTDLHVKKVNIYTDFDKLSPEIEVSVSIKTRLIYAVIAAVTLFFEYLRIKKESDKNGRK